MPTPRPLGISILVFAAAVAAENREATGTKTATAIAGGSTLFSVSSLTTEYLPSPLGVDVPSPRVSWRIRPRDSASPRRGIRQRAYRIEVSTEADFTGDDVWDCGRVDSPSSSLVPLLSGGCGGSRLVSDAEYHWRVTAILDDGSAATGSSTFRTGLLSRDDWKARWITGGDAETLLRSEFRAPAVRRYATLYVSGIGYHEVHINGDKVGDRSLDPGWTDYAKRVWYAAHDVTERVRDGANAIGAALGNGWWSCGPPPGTGIPRCSESPPQLLLQLHVDGAPVLVTDAGADADRRWRSAAGPITYDSLYNGEVFDGRIAERLEGWTAPGFNDSDWTPAIPADSVADNSALTSQLFEPIRRASAHGPVGVTSPEPGAQVWDFGRNAAGVVRLKRVTCDRGSNVTIRHAEVLTHPPYGPSDGSLYVDNLRTARATDVYICRGDADGESYTPTFTQHGFRYAEVTGPNYPLNGDDIEAVELHSDLSPSSSLLFSHPLLNEIQSAVVRGQKSNLMSVPTDCDQRDERRGWMGDAAVTAEEAAYNFNMGAFYTHWLMQIADAQDGDGSVPDYVPALGTSHGSPNWESAFPTIVWVLWRYYGDRDVPVRYHDALVRYFDYFEGTYNRTGIEDFTTGYGDWVPPPPNPKADGHLTGAFAFLHDLKLGAEVFASSSHPGAPERARRCAALLAKLSTEYHEAFYNYTAGVYVSGLQTEQALPLWLGVVPESLRSDVLSRLIQDIEVTNSGHTTCGIVGIKFLMETLSLHGRSDVALTIALQTTYPSWGYMLHNEYEPSTTIWEVWDGDTADPHMNSRNHIMFGSVSSWFHKFLAGVTPAEPGFARVSVRPSIVDRPDLAHSSAGVVTPHGDVLSAWRVETMNRTRVYTHELSIPPNTDAVLAIPLSFDSRGRRRGARAASDGVVIAEGGVCVWADGRYRPGVPGVTSGERVGDAVEFRLTNGRFVFTARVPSETTADRGDDENASVA